MIEAIYGALTGILITCLYINCRSDVTHEISEKSTDTAVTIIWIYTISAMIRLTALVKEFINTW